MSKRKAFRLNTGIKEGLQQTVRAAQSKRGQKLLEYIPLTKIDLDPTNPRELTLCIDDFKFEPDESGAIKAVLAISESDPTAKQKWADVEALAEITDSIQRQGVQQSINVYRDGERFRLIAGERRCLGSLLAGEEWIPANIHPERPSNVKTLQFIENIHRSSLSPWEKVKNIIGIIDEEGLKDANGHVSRQALANVASISKAQAHKYLSVIAADTDILDALKQNRINLAKAAELTKIRKEDREKLIEESATYDEIKLAAQEEKGEPQESNSAQNPGSETTSEAERPSPQPQRLGRKPTKVNLGSSKNLSAVKLAVSKLVSEHEFEQLSKTTDWHDYSSAGEAFQWAWSQIEEQA